MQINPSEETKNLKEQIKQFRADYLGEFNDNI